MIKRISAEILHGLARLHHMQHQLHRDLKPENLLVKTPLQIKISDLGISASLEHTNQKLKNTDGTYLYMSPERLNTQEYSYQADIWSFGIIIYEMMLTHYPFKSYKSYFDLLQFFREMDQVVPDKVHDYSPELVAFLKQCLCMDPANRPSSLQLLTHPWYLMD